LYSKLGLGTISPSPIAMHAPILTTRETHFNP
jgi:hypothetical protein